MPHTHWPGGKGPVCRFRTKKECDEEYVNWQASNQVRLAAYVIENGRADRHTKGTAVFDQVVQVLNGSRATIENDDGTPSKSPFTRRVLAAIEDYKKGIA